LQAQAIGHMPKPKIQKTATKDHHYSVNVSDEERDLIDRAAIADGEEKVSRWGRKVMVREARRVLGEQKK
jgi:uncharacterized protein (DUF1778 family)